MACEHPLLAVDLGVLNPETGKRKIKLLPFRADYSFRDLESKYGDALLCLPCGKCPSCILAYRKNWAIRCTLEAKLHSDNCFLTLTYDEAHVPKKLIKRDLQDFIKDLRATGIKFRYFACGEYGTQTFRCHYHMLMFGYMPSDLKPIGKNEHGYLYKSDFLASIWKKGNISVAEFTEDTAFYVAGYVDKKLEQKLPFEVTKQNKPFILMSLRPGIGYEYLVTHKDSIIEHDSIVLPGGNIVAPGRYSDKVLEVPDYVKVERLKYQRVRENSEMVVSSLDHREKLWLLKGKEKEKKLLRLKKGL